VTAPLRPGAMPGLAIAVVTDVDDQERLGRIRIRYPWLDHSLKSDWISVVAPSAGKDRGLFWMPEIDDEVVVGFLQGDFAQPVVLGGTWNVPNPAPSPDHRQRMLRSKNGPTIRFIDSTPTNGDLGGLVIQDGHGNTIAMSNGYVTISTAGTMVLEASAIQLRGNGWMRTVTPNSNPI
jgi:phage baseplate assembly protein V